MLIKSSSLDINKALDHIFFTDYLDFHLYEHGEFVDSVRVAEVKGDKIVAIPENEEKFLNLIDHVGNNAIQRVISASRLAKAMAGKARLLENIIEQAMNDDTDSYANENLHGQYQAFQRCTYSRTEACGFCRHLRTDHRLRYVCRLVCTMTRQRTLVVRRLHV